jgi:hypothetical protein
MANVKTLDRPIRVGVFNTVEAAQRAVRGLMAAGFSPDEITVICSDPLKERHFRAFEHQEPAGTSTPAAVFAGGAIGAAVAGVTVVLIGAATGGVGLLAAGGAAAWAGGVAGGLVGAMMTRGVEKELANYYNQAVLDGKILVAAEKQAEKQIVKQNSQHPSLAKAEAILTEAGAEPIALPEG